MSAREGNIFTRDYSPELYVRRLPYNGKLWRRKTLANFKTMALAEKTLVNCLKIRDWRGKTLANLLLSWKSTGA